MFHNSGRYSAACFQMSPWPFGLALRRSSISSSRSRALLRKICSLPARYCGGQWIARRAVPGGRPHGEVRIDEMRARERDEVGAAGGNDGVDLVGGGDGADAHGGEPAPRCGSDRRTASGTCGRRPAARPPWSGRSTRRSGRSRPRRTARATSTASSPVSPPSAQSVAEMRTDIGFSSGQAARMARKTSSGKRMRFSSEPP